jgi:hypothetical protein
MAAPDHSGRCGGHSRPTPIRREDCAISVRPRDSSGKGCYLQPTSATLNNVPVRFIFRCQFCDAQPDPLTQLRLQGAMREFVWGAYQNALPGRWLIWHGRGLYGPARYACPEHRGDLVAYLREHYGTIGFHPWKRPPYPNSLESSDTDHAWITATRRQRWSGF